MAQPPAYNRTKDFAEDFGNETDHSALNAELDRASNSINDIRTNLAILQADDGKLRPAVVTSDSLSAELKEYVIEQATSGAAGYAAIASGSAATAVANSAAAAQSATNAAASEAAASQSETNAATSETNAAASAATALASKNSASESATSASASAERAETAKTGAETAYANAADLYGDLQSVHDAVAAAGTSADNAAASAASAAASSASALASKNSASESATSASASADNAEAAKSALEEARDSAAASATTATQKAGEATASATSAAASAQDAYNYAQQAATGQVNADWNATSGKAQILNKPVLSAVATSGNYADLNGKPALAAVATSGSYNDLQNKPATMTGATAEAAGTSGFVPAPQAGDAEKVLTGNGEWKVLGKATTEQAGIVRPDGTSINVSDGVISVSPEVAENALGKGQNWVNVTTKRVSNTVYTNTTGKPIFVSVSREQGSAWMTITAYVDNVLVGGAAGYYTTVQKQHISFVVPNGSTYKVVCEAGFFNWSELR